MNNRNSSKYTPLIIGKIKLNLIIKKRKNKPQCQQIPRNFLPERNCAKPDKKNDNKTPTHFL